MDEPSAAQKIRAEQRQKREAAALRANLRRRKQQQDQRTGRAEVAAPDDGLGDAKKPPVTSS